MGIVAGFWQRGGGPSIVGESLLVLSGREARALRTCGEFGRRGGTELESFAT